MEILVCVKRVPDTAENEIEVNSDGSDIERDDLVYSVNEWDNYAVEEAIQIRDNVGGNVTVITVGDDESEEVLRREMAMGADNGLLLSYQYDDLDIGGDTFQPVEDELGLIASIDPLVDLGGISVTLADSAQGVALEVELMDEVSYHSQEGKAWRSVLGGPWTPDNKVDDYPPPGYNQWRLRKSY